MPYFEYDKIAQKVRAASKARSPLINKLGKRVAKQLRALGLHNLLGRLKNSAAVQGALYKKIDVTNTDHYSDLPADVIDRYLENIARLETLIGRPLEGWRQEIETHRTG